MQEKTLLPQATQGKNAALGEEDVLLEWQQAFEEADALFQKRPPQHEFLMECGRALNLVNFGKIVQQGEFKWLGAATLILLSGLLPAFIKPLQKLFSRPPAQPPRLPAAQAGLCLAPRLLPAPAALLAG